MLLAVCISSYQLIIVLRKTNQEQGSMGLNIVKVYMTDFFICSIKSPQCTDKCSKKIFLIAIFLPRVLLCQKCQISLPVGYRTARPKTGDWERL